MDNHAVVSELNGRLMTIGKADFIAPTAVGGNGVRLAKEEVSFRIKRLYTLWRKLLEENRKFALRAETKPLDLEMKSEFCDLVYRAYRLQVWRDFPELAGKPFELYDGWLIGSEKPQGDLFKQSEPASIGSDDNLGAILPAVKSNDGMCGAQPRQA